MAKQTGPVTTQRERKAASAAAAAASLTSNTNETDPTSLEGDNSETNKPPHTEIPQEQFLRWFGLFASKHISNDRVIQVGCLSFVILQAYIQFTAVDRTDAEMELVSTGITGVLAFLVAIVIGHRVKVQALPLEKQSEVKMPLWNNVYLGFLPAMLAYVLNAKELLAYNVAFTTTIIDLPFAVQIMTQTTFLTYNSAHYYGIFNLQMCVLHYGVNFFLKQVSHLKSLDPVECNLFSILIVDLYLISSDLVYVVILQKLGIAFAVGVVVTFLLNIIIQGNNLLRSVAILAAWLGSFCYVALYLLDPILGENAVVWILDFITETKQRQNILTVWLCSLLLLIPTIFNYRFSLSANSRRKIWHFLILILVVYPLYVDPEFVKVCLSGTLVLFLMVEQLRYLKLSPFGEYLDTQLRTFTDFRDERGPLIFSYIYLMIGITFPILVNGSVVGLVVLGAGDSLASIIGSTYGEIHWGKSKKTLEGTMTFVVATYAICALLKSMQWFFADKSFHSLLLTCVVSGVLEGNSDLNDNILIPGFMVAMLEVLD
ncbi:hypothetical protein WICPIJ_001457 [Wickerhamomyces pijperi]|uniref:dolichol kinase n=1 Tax=Wickerhamomyces pijperi TaxID=599730 RepID=A0A9P8TQK4_WICPI|nr:hypothetical protein WICPIJ_001457 [Wickerhamomyces pijperi]